MPTTITQSNVNSGQYLLEKQLRNYALKNNPKQLLNFLKANPGINIDAKSHTGGLTALHCATKNKRLANVKILLDL